MCPIQLARKEHISREENDARKLLLSDELREEAVVFTMLAGAQISRACSGPHWICLGSSGIKFEVEGGEGSPGADTYIPLHRKIAILQHFSETFRKMLYFGEIPKKFGQN